MTFNLCIFTRLMFTFGYQRAHDTIYLAKKCTVNNGAQYKFSIFNKRALICSGFIDYIESLTNRAPQGSFFILKPVFLFVLNILTMSCEIDKGILHRCSNFSFKHRMIHTVVISYDTHRSHIV